MITCKSLMAASALVLLTTAAAAAPAEDPYRLCDEVASLIEEVADAHQSGVPLSTVLDVVARTINSEGVDSVRVLVIEVYSGRRWHTEDNQARAVSDWRNAAHVGCLRGRGVAG